MLQHSIYFHFETFFKKIQKKFAIFLVKIYYFLIVNATFVIYFRNFDVSLDVLI